MTQASQRIMAGFAKFTRQDAIAAGIAGGGAVLLVVHALALRRVFLGNSVDDAYISYRYADHLLRGLGLVFNPGEHVEGYSNFLWVLLLALVQAAGADPVSGSQVVGLASSVASLALAVTAVWKFVDARRVGFALFTSMLLACSGYVAAWAVGGLEGPLFGLLLVAAWMAVAGRGAERLHRQIVAAVLFAALALTRPEGGLLAIGAVAAHLWGARRRRAPWRAARTWLFPAVVLVFMAAYHGWRFAYYGPHLFPNAVRAKLGGGIDSPLRGLRYVGKQFLLPYIPLLLPLLWPRSWKGFDRVLAGTLRTGFALLGGMLVLIVGVGGDWSQGRFFAPLLPLGATLFVIWLGNRRDAALWDNGRVRRAALASVAAAFLVVTFLSTSVRREAAVRRSYAAVDAERIALGKWLAETMPADVIIAVHAAGQIPYYSRLYTHDMLGLNDAHIAGLSVPLFGKGYPGHEKYDPAYTLETVRPGIIVEGRRIPGLERHFLYKNEYYPLTHFWKLHQVAIRRDLAARLGVLQASGPD